MPSPFLSQLPVLLPLAAQWVAGQEGVILERGVPLDASQLQDARRVGVHAPEKIRLLSVSRIPAPEHPVLRQAAAMTGLISPQTAGLTLRYGIFVRQDCWGDRELVVHECVHVAQYERFGGITEFLAAYLEECLRLGYENAPLEREARSEAKPVVRGTRA